MRLDDDRQFVAVRAGIERYYTRKVHRYGATPRGADWTCLATQELRFVQLLKLCDFSAAFSINDVGCGYGALATYLGKYHAEAQIDYLGIDVSPEMVQRAKRRRWGPTRASFVVGNISPRVADYSVASGIFNVKLKQPSNLWERFISHTLAGMHANSRSGFAVNFMAPLAPGQPNQMQLYRTSPGRWAGYCAREFECHVEVLADYGMREFTLLVRR